MKLKPKPVRHRKIVTIGNYVFAFLTIAIFLGGVILGLFPALRSVWSLMLFVPFSLAFAAAYNWALSYTEELDKKLGESKEEQRRKLEAHLGIPFYKNDHRR